MRERMIVPSRPRATSDQPVTTPTFGDPFRGLTIDMITSCKLNLRPGCGVSDLEASAIFISMPFTLFFFTTIYRPEATSICTPTMPPASLASEGSYPRIHGSSNVRSVDNAWKQVTTANVKAHPSFVTSRALFTSELLELSELTELFTEPVAFDLPTNFPLHFQTRRRLRNPSPSAHRQLLWTEL